MRKVDLNLVRVFNAIMQHRSVSGASKELGVTPSAVSHALARLRDALGDELFVPGDAGMAPTPRALELAPGIRDGLERISGALNTSSFVPSKAVRTFRIAATDFFTSLVLPKLVGRILATAPGIELRIFPVNRLDMIRQLDEGRLDFVLGWFSDLPNRMRRTAVLMEREALVVRPDHPLTREQVTRERLFAFPHIVVELTGTEEEAPDGFLDDRGVSRRIWIERLLIETNDDGDGPAGRVSVSVPYYSAIPPMLQETDMVATLPRRLALSAAASGALAILDLPYEPLTVTLEAIWHQRVEQDSGAQWLIGELVDAMKSVDA